MAFCSSYPLATDWLSVTIDRATKKGTFFCLCKITKTLQYVGQELSWQHLGRLKN